MPCNLKLNVVGCSFENMLESYFQVYFIKYDSLIGYIKIPKKKPVGFIVLKAIARNSWMGSR